MLEEMLEDISVGVEDTSEDHSSIHRRVKRKLVYFSRQAHKWDLPIRYLFDDGHGKFSFNKQYVKNGFFRLIKLSS